MLKTITLISQIKLVCNPKDIRPPMEVKKAIATDSKQTVIYRCWIFFVNLRSILKADVCVLLKYDAF